MLLTSMFIVQPGQGFEKGPFKTLLVYSFQSKNYCDVHCLLQNVICSFIYEPVDVLDCLQEPIIIRQGFF